MASKQTYPCFTCKKAGYEVQVYLDGKDTEGHTKYLNEDGVTKHIHKGQQPQEQYETKFTKNVNLHTGSTHESQQQEQQQPQQQEHQRTKDYGVSEESVQRGISAFSIMTGLIRLVEQTQKYLITMDGKIEHLTKLVYALSQSQQQSLLEKVTIVEESIQKGITTQKKFEDLVITAEGMTIRQG